MVVLLAAPSETLLDLPAAVHGFRRAIATLRRRRWFSTGIPAGALVIEAPLTLDHQRWNVHAHGVVDAPRDSPEFRERCAKQWRELAPGAAAEFGFQQLRDLRGIFRYGLKVGRNKSTAPDAGTLSPSLMAHLEVALRGKWLTVTWGRPAAADARRSPSPASRARAGTNV